MQRRRGPTGPVTGLVIAALFVAGGALVWVAFAVADFRSPTAGQAVSDPSRPPTVDEPAPSGWAPVEPVALDPGIIDLAAPVPTDLAASLLDQTLSAARVVVTVDEAVEPGLGVAQRLARDLHAPLLVLDRPVLEPSGPDTSTTPGPSSSGSETTDDEDTGASEEPTDTENATEDDTGDASPDDEPGIDGTDGTDGGDGVAEAGDDGAAPTAPSTTELLQALGTAHVVAIGDAPSTSATVHEVVVEATTPGSEGADGEPATGDQSSTPTEDGTDEQPTVILPEAVDALLADAAAWEATDEMADVTMEDTTALVAADEPAPDLAVALDLLGMQTITLADEDPRRDEELQSALQGMETTLLAVADDQWPELEMTTVPPDWAALVRTAVEAPELFGGGKVLFPERTFIAAYGNFRGPALGVLGEREPEESVEYVEGLVDDYEGLFGDSQVQPAFEIIVTVASSVPEEDGSYSRKEDLDLVTEWVDAAIEEDVYVILDLQPGREDFLTQAKRLEDLLRRPNVGLALDPEWRLLPDQVHLEQIGTVTTEEVNQVSEWLAELVRDEVLPQKLFILHNFRLSMTTDREDLRFPAELATMLHVDGQGPQRLKDDTYEVLTEAGPDEFWWGWKNFFDEDSPEVRSPEDTADIEPVPHLITYQ